jgi:hypothetical protein
MNQTGSTQRRSRSGFFTLAVMRFALTPTKPNRPPPFKNGYN